MALDRIAAWLTQKTGLDPAAVGPQAVALAVERRMAACGVSDEGGYEERLLASAEERQSLVDEVVVRETWFFRDGGPFALVQRHVREHWLPTHPGGVLRVLSVPCATGEEPCSIAIALAEAGLAWQSFRVDAFDLSRAAIARCREAAYGPSSFRGGRLELRERYFTAVDGLYRPLPEVTASIAFRQGNLLEPGFAAGAPYDLVFCRNLLIYFDQAARKLATNTLYRLLADDGLLFAGHSETSYTLGDRFAPTGEPGAFAYRKVLARAQPAFPPALPSARPVPPPAPPKPPTPAAPPRPVAVDDSRSLLERARQLSDAGALDAAAAICRQLINRDNPAAEAFFLLGLIEEALGDKLQAEGRYTRALFLDPNHYESLVHLTLLVESRGDAGRGAALRARAQRLREAENSHAG